MTTTATTIRSPAVAGMFYPANPQELHQMVHQFLQAVTIGINQATKATLVPKAIIVLMPVIFIQVLWPPVFMLTSPQSVK